MSTVKGNLRLIGDNALQNGVNTAEHDTISAALTRANAREVAMREILSAISRYRDDVQPVLECIARNAGELCDAPDVGLHLVNKARTHTRIACVWGPDKGVFPVGTEFELSGTTAMARAIREARTTQIRDFSKDPRYLAREPGPVKKVEEEGVLTFLCVPFVQNGIAIGCVTLNRYEVKPFTEDEIALLETFAAQAVIAIENVRQFREVQERLRRERASAKVLEIISQSRDNDRQVFDAILENACKLCDAPFAGLYLLDEARSEITLVSSLGARSEYLSGGTRTWSIDDPASVGVAIREARVEQAYDIRDTEAYRNGNPQRVEAANIEGIRTFVAVPLLHGGVAIGAIGLYRREVAPFLPEQIALVESFSAQAVIAIENTRQFNALQTLNAELGERVEEQVGEIERMGKLKRFLPSAVANTIVSSGSEGLLKSHRALLGVLFCDIRGFTAFCETAEPEETIEVLQIYHEEMGKLIDAHGAGVDHRMGDGIMVLFNDPLPCEDPAGDAVKLAIAMRARMSDLCRAWKRMGYRLGFGVGISLGYATVGMVGFEGRSDYTASGTAVNLASRLCDEAEDGEILLSTRAAIAVEDVFASVSVGEVSLKGIREPVEVFRLDSA
ncbi:hypothetical protein C1J05_13965 [Sulfitobacter sp. JL08]|uniref:GAF domain-containing protein n=1 Tax=Sulfitobacter sp. JL08 TaxID=2070369 RepID=UPI000E0B467D|nr:GAF domain-containing protein [Sulfitobacter sp. JL08]AXI55464.1 hypothetical protein C1J05_13965 [Sulfitobacter sp. JL08]